MSNALVVSNPGTLMGQASDVAGVCTEIVKRTAQVIQGRKYVKVEGWQSIAAAYGCVASAKDVERVQGGVRAVGELRRASDGQLIASAVGFVGEDEPTWYGGEIVSYGKTKTLPKRPDFAIQAMAQTRAISRVCRSAFAFVVVLIDSNLSTTPAEEMSGIVHEQQQEEIQIDWSLELRKAKTREQLGATWASIPQDQKSKHLAEKDLLKMQFTSKPQAAEGELPSSSPSSSSAGLGAGDTK